MSGVFAFGTGNQSVNSIVARTCQTFHLIRHTAQMPRLVAVLFLDFAVLEDRVNVSHFDILAACWRNQLWKFFVLVRLLCQEMLHFSCSSERSLEPLCRVIHHHGRCTVAAKGFRIDGEWIFLMPSPTRPFSTS